MIISVIAGLVTAFSVYQGFHAVDTMVQTKKAAKDTANDIVDSIGDIFEDADDITEDVIVEEPIIVDVADEDSINNDDDGDSSDDGEQPPTQPRNKKGQFAKK